MLLGDAAHPEAVLLVALEVVVGDVVVQARRVARPARLLQRRVHRAHERVGVFVQVGQAAVDVVGREAALAGEPPPGLPGGELGGGVRYAVPHEQLQDPAGVVGEPARRALALEERPDPEVAVEVGGRHRRAELDAALGALVYLLGGGELHGDGRLGARGLGGHAPALLLEVGDGVVELRLEGVDVAEAFDRPGPVLAARVAVALHDREVCAPVGLLRLPEVHIVVLTWVYTMPDYTIRSHTTAYKVVKT